MQLLVTGADGFIGNSLYSALCDSGHSVRKSVWILKAHMSDDSWVKTGDIGIDTNWSEAIKGVDVVIHLAGRAHILKETVQDALAEFRRVNVFATKQLAETAAQSGVRRFIFVSSIGVNGNSTLKDTPFTEESIPNPVSPYAISKWEAEQALHTIAMSTKLEVVIVRPTLVYGPGVPGNFRQLLKLVDKALPLPLANIQNHRSFISRTNLVDFLLRCVEHPAAAGETFLISDGEDVSTSELIRKIAHHLDRPARLFSLPESLCRLGSKIIGKEHAMDQLFCSLAIDSSKARKLLGWQPVVSMDEELAKIGKWFKEARGHNVV